MKERNVRFHGVEEYLAERRQIERKMRRRKITAAAGLLLITFSGFALLKPNKESGSAEISLAEAKFYQMADTTSFADPFTKENVLVEEDNFEEYVQPVVDRVEFTQAESETSLQRSSITYSTKSSIAKTDDKGVDIAPEKLSPSSERMIRPKNENSLVKSVESPKKKRYSQKDFENQSKNAVMQAPVPPSEAWGSTQEMRVYDKPLIMAEKMPVFPGGEKELEKFIKKNLRYPKKAKKAGIEGHVFVRFVVEADGTIKNIAVNNGLGYGCDEEAIRLVNKMPNWIPGENYGYKVAVHYSVPILFSL